MYRRTQMSAQRPNYSSIMSQDQEKEYHDILVVGKSGNGKSAVCNTLVGAEVFPVGRGMATTTTTAQFNDIQRGNMTIRVIDTPDITNCGLYSASQKQEEVRKWKNLLALPHPSLLLVAVRCDVRYTAEEFAIFREIQRFWGDSSLDKHVAVAFTFGERQDYDIKDDVRNAPPELAGILRRAKERYLVFTNKDSADRPAQAQQCFALMQRVNDRTSPCPCSCLWECLRCICNALQRCLARILECLCCQP